MFSKNMVLETLYPLVRDYSDNNLEVPAFQRDVGSWSRPKEDLYIVNIRDGWSGGTIITYTLKGSRIRYVLDGVQRLGANADELGRDHTYKRILEKARVFVHEQDHQTHFEAYREFQIANDGTGLTTAEYYRGALTEGTGAKNGRIAANQLTGIFEVITTPSALQWKSQNLPRDNYTTFLQYLRKDADLPHVDYGKRLLTGSSVEEDLREELRGKSVRAELDGFKLVLERHMALIVEVRAEAGLEDYMISGSLVRQLFQLLTWFQSQDITVPSQKKFIALAFNTTNAAKKTIQAEQIVRDGDGLPKRYSTRAGKTKTLLGFAEDRGWAPEYGTKGGSIATPPGYDGSHVNPGVDEEQVAEASASNRSRNDRGQYA